MSTSESAALGNAGLKRIVVLQNTSNYDSYFSAVHSMLLKGGYRVGVYGSGRTCRIIKAAGLAGYTWMAMSTGRVNIPLIQIGILNNYKL